MNNRHPTAEELLIGFMESYHDVIKELKEKKKYLKRTNQTTEAETVHAYLRIIQKYFNERGNLPV
jgi:hypothetical protein